MKQRHLGEVRAQNVVARLGLPLLVVAVLGSSGACASLAGLSSFADGDWTDGGGVALGSDAFAPGASDDGSTAAGEPPGHATDDSTGDATVASGADASTPAGDDAGGTATGDGSSGTAGDDAAATDGAADARCGNVSTDENNCGSCGFVCATGTTCTGGQCKESSTSAYVCATTLTHTPVCASTTTTACARTTASATATASTS